MARTRYRFLEDNHAYFLTDTVVAWLPVFAQPVMAEILLESLRFLQAKAHLRLFGYVLLENHLHWIAAAPDLSRVVARFKSFTARRCIDEMEHSGRLSLLAELRRHRLPHKVDQAHQLWQEGSHPQQIQSAEMMLQKLEYMHHNPVRRGYVDEPTHWRYSSARNYAGMPCLLEVEIGWR